MYYKDFVVADVTVGIKFAQDLLSAEDLEGFVIR